MIRPSIDELNINDRFLAVTLIAKRAREIEQGKRPITNPPKERAVAQAAKEISLGLIKGEING